MSEQPPTSLDHLVIDESSSSLTEATAVPLQDAQLPASEGATLAVNPDPDPAPDPDTPHSQTRPTPSTPPPNSSAASTPNAQSTTMSLSYVSSASSTTGAASPFAAQQLQGQPPSKPQQPSPSPPPPPETPRDPPKPMTTINNATPRETTTVVRRDSDEVMNIPPVHPFFHMQNSSTAQYDSDGSNGSYVQKRRRSTHRHQQSRERFPSFDSMASSGSVKYVSSSNSAGPSPSRNSPTTINPQLLPYHERRKLMQQRQQQQQQQVRNPRAVPAEQPQPFSANARVPYPMQPAPHGMDPRMMNPEVPALPSYIPSQGQPSPQQHQSYPPPPYGSHPMDPAAMTAFNNVYAFSPIPPQFTQHPATSGPASYQNTSPHPYPPPHAYYQYYAQQQQHQQQPPPHSQNPQQQINMPFYGYPPPGYVAQPPPFPDPSHRPPSPDGKSQAPVPAAKRSTPIRTTPSAKSTQDRPPKGKSTTSSRGNAPGLNVPSVPPIMASSGSGNANQRSPRQSPAPNKVTTPAAAPSTTIAPPQPPPIANQESATSMHQNQRLALLQSSSTDGSTDSNLPPPPPPPTVPPPPLPANTIESFQSRHFHGNSIGSMSSLGSNPGSDDPKAKNPVATQNSLPSPQSRHHRQNSSGSFLDIFKKPSTPQKTTAEPSVAEYRRRNQEFLRGTTSSPRSQRPTAFPKPKHQRVGSQDRPPASRGTHKRLPSITNDDWGEPAPRVESSQDTASGEASEGGYSSSSDADSLKPLAPRNRNNRHENEDPDFEDESDERASLLPPSGISTNERDEARISRGSTQGRSTSDRLMGYGAGGDARETYFHSERKDSRKRQLFDQSPIGTNANVSAGRKNRKKKHKHKRKRKASSRHKSSNGPDGQGEEVSSESSGEDSSNYDYRQWMKSRAHMLERERAKMIAQWKAEAKAEVEQARREAEANRWYRRFGRYMEASWQHFLLWCEGLVTGIETFFANLPLTIGAIAMAVVTLGVVWFKFAEENLTSCEPVHFHSSQCTLPEFPGCFYCDTDSRLYKLALAFHYGCSIVAGVLALCFVIKVVLATRVVLDEMSSPTTASPAGLLCMTTVCVFAGRGAIGQFMVTSAACLHLGLAIWFIYMALAYRIMPEPSWFPNTVGIGLSAVKAWLYYPTLGHFLMAVCLLSNFFFFPISLIRVVVNEKISATVGWMQMSAPAISLYALTIMAQPSFPEEHPDVTHFQVVHRMIYLPCMHVMAALTILGFLASCHSLSTRWYDFKKREFSPAHAAFCFPVLSHANALQAYRGAIISFSDIHPHSWRMIVLYTYWCSVLIGGTIATFWITTKYLLSLPKWTNLDLSDEEEPPGPSETILQLRHALTTGETMKQVFVSPAVLQANETGALVLAPTGPDGQLRYVRTRRLLSLGFEPTMGWSEMQQEREVLLDWVGKHPPRRRHRTLSVPGVDFSYGAGLGTGNSGVYGAVGWSPQVGGRRRADTDSPRAYY